MPLAEVEYSSIPRGNTSGAPAMNFKEFQRRLTANLRERVRSGEATERGLARLTRVSQPHLHQVLNGTKDLSPEMADRVMQRLRMDLLDLMEPGEILEWRRRAWK